MNTFTYIWIIQFVSFFITPHLYTLSYVFLLLYCHRRDYFVWFNMCRKLWQGLYPRPTYSMEQSPSSEANRFSASQISHILWNPDVHNCSQKCPPPVPVLSHIDPVHALISHFWRAIFIFSSHLGLGLPSDFFPSGFPTKTLNTPPFSPILATCPPHLIILYLIIWTILREEYSSCSSSLCGFLHSPVTLSLLGPNILLSTLLSNTILHSSLNVSDQVALPHTTGKFIVLYISVFKLLNSKLEDKGFCTEW